MTSWKTLTAACALAAATLAGSIAQASAENRQVALDYDVRIGGIHGMRAETVLRVAGDRFEAKAEVGKEGLLDAISKSYRAVHVSRGRVLEGRLAPAESVAQIVNGKDARSFRASYGSDGNLSFAENPAPEIKPGREVSAAQRRGAWDPLMAAAMAVMGRDDPCGGTIPVYDGRNRFDLVPKRIGTESFPSEDFKIQGKSIVCEVRLRKIAGYKPGTNPDEDFDNAAKLWLGVLDDSGRLYPLRVEVESNLGTIVGQLKKASIRPLTEEERLALLK